VLKKTRLRTNYLILQELLEYSKPVEYRKKIIGYGLKSVDFSRYVTRKIFRTNIEYFLKIGFITELITVDKRSQYYSITPIGICYLIKNEHYVDRITSEEIKEIFKIMFTFYDNNIEIKSKIFGATPPDFQILFKRLSAVFDSHDIRESLDFILDQLIIIHLRHSAEFFIPISDNINFKLATLREDIITEHETVDKFFIHRKDILITDIKEYHTYFVYYFFITTIFFFIISEYKSMFRHGDFEKNVIKNLDEEMLRCAFGILNRVGESINETISFTSIVKKQLSEFQLSDNPERIYTTKIKNSLTQ